jgi:ATP-dependent DNA helicase RecG
VETDNANKPSSYGLINPEKFSPFPKNPTIARFFVQLGLVEELGSGIRNVTKLLKHYSPNQVAEFIEEDVFRAIVPVSRTVDAKPSNPANLLTRLEKEIERIAVQDAIQQRLSDEVTLFASGRAYSATELSELLRVNPRTVRRDFAILQEADIIKPSDSYGLYELADKWSVR